jgi:3-oxoacyl-[acyl-carrier-protein] synthase-3
MLKDVYITAFGKFLPGDPVPNEEIEKYLGPLQGSSAFVKDRVLRQSGIETRYYALDTSQHTRYLNSEMAARAVQDALDRAGITSQEVEYLAAATSQGDMVLPGFASMVHGELDVPPCEIASLQGFCASGALSLKSAFLQIRANEKRSAVACASEFASRLFKASRYDARRLQNGKGRIPYDVELLRWMLSDGAGAAVLQDQPNRNGISLKVEWIDITSYASRFPTCMYVGRRSNECGESSPTWLDYPTYEQAVADGALYLRQDLKLLDHMVKIGVERLGALVSEGRVRLEELSWFVCHYSSEVFRARIAALLATSGLSIPAERWFSNLRSRGNVGSAALYLLLEDLFYQVPLKAGQKILCVIPESGRFMVAFALLTVVGEQAPGREVVADAPAASEPRIPPLQVSPDPMQQRLARDLTQVWLEFETRLAGVPIVRKIERGSLTMEEYKHLLFNLRQQVIDGSRWISRAASNISADYFPLRSAFIAHTADEHRDFELIERDYVAVGGEREAIVRGEKNIGSEALSAWIMYQASQENPFDLLGAMFIIEGLGARLAGRWGRLIQSGLSLRDDQVSFFLYHAQSDPQHFARLNLAVEFGVLTDALVARIVKTAKVTARLYALQLEELDRI